MEYYEKNKEEVADRKEEVAGGKEEVADGKENLLLALAGLFNQISSQEKQTGVIDTESFMQIVMTPGNGFVKVPFLYERVRDAYIDISGLDNASEGMNTATIQSPTDDSGSDSCLGADIGTRDRDRFDSEVESKFDLQKHDRGDDSSSDEWDLIDRQCQLMSTNEKLALDERLKLELQSIGIDLDPPDPYDFLNSLLSEVDKTVKEDSSTTGHQDFKMPLVTLLDDLQGIVADMRCAMCKTEKAKDQTVFTLSLDVAQHRSFVALPGDFNFNSWVTMDKLPCEKCGRDQDAEKRLVMKEKPHILIIHLRRFKDSGGDGLKKLSDEVSVPPSLQLGFKYRETCYLLSAIVLQTRVTPKLSHYVCLVKSHDRWILFYDDKVKMTDVPALQSPFASGSRNYTSSKDAYILFYERTD